MSPHFLALTLALAWSLTGSGAAAQSTTSTTVLTTTTTTTSTTVNTTTSTSTTVVTTTSTSTTETTSTSTTFTTTTSTSTTSTTSTSIQVCQCNDLPFLAETTAILAPATTMTADLAVNRVFGIAKLSPTATMTNGTTLTADRVWLAAGASVYDVRTNVLIAGSTSGIGGTVTPVSLPLRTPHCTLPALTCGTGSVLVTGNITELELPAGDYGTVQVGEGALLRLEENGVYRFCELKIDSGGSLLAKHQITIEVPGNVFVGSNSSIRTSGLAPLILRVGGTKVLLGRDALITAAITAPNAKVKVKQRSAIEGCVCARIIKAGEGANLDCTGDSPSGAFLD